jgi:hypothetical protein
MLQRALKQTPWKEYVSGGKKYFYNVRSANFLPISAHGFCRHRRKSPSGICLRSFRCSWKRLRRRPRRLQHHQLPRMCRALFFVQFDVHTTSPQICFPGRCPSPCGGSPTWFLGPFRRGQPPRATHQSSNPKPPPATAVGTSCTSQPPR